MPELHFNAGRAASRQPPSGGDCRRIGTWLALLVPPPLLLLMLVLSNQQDEGGRTQTAASTRAPPPFQEPPPREPPPRTPPLRPPPPPPVKPSGGIEIHYEGGQSVQVPISRFSREGKTHGYGPLSWDVCDPEWISSQEGRSAPAPNLVSGFTVRGKGLRVQVGDVCSWTYDYPDSGVQSQVYTPDSGVVERKGSVFYTVVEENIPPMPTPKPPPKFLTYWERPGVTPVPTSGTLTPRAVAPAEKGIRVAADGRPVVAYAITVTKDGPYVDGAAVLGHSILRQHRTGGESRYAAELVALVKPTCVRTKVQLRSLKVAGQEWRILDRVCPIDLKKTPKVYQDDAAGGCCGADELIKLHAWLLTEYHRVVHLDMDTILLQNIDDVLERNASLSYTVDWGMASPASRKPPVQGGFLVVRPDPAVFQELQAFAQRGGFVPDGTGWEKSYTGHFWGGATIQGLLAFFFNVVHPEWGYREDHCRLNCQADRPFRDDKAAKGKKLCFDDTKTSANCPDCRNTPVDEVRHAHFTICQKPWICFRGHMRLCRELHEKWFDTRRDLEDKMGTFREGSTKACKPEFAVRHGFCSCDGEKNYVPLRLPKDAGGEGI
eukprot:Hpha_TRINITY_DN23449_c0_g1::TRINITY_DN23449_c0_g1_i1::g.113932::m.113932